MIGIIQLHRDNWAHFKSYIFRCWKWKRTKTFDKHNPSSSKLIHRGQNSSVNLPGRRKSSEASRRNHVSITSENILHLHHHIVYVVGLFVLPDIEVFGGEIYQLPTQCEVSSWWLKKSWSNSDVNLIFQKQQTEGSATHTTNRWTLRWSRLGRERIERFPQHQ